MPSVDTIVQNQQKWEESSIVEVNANVKQVKNLVHERKEDNNSNISKGNS